MTDINLQDNEIEEITFSVPSPFIGHFLSKCYENCDVTKWTTWHFMHIQRDDEDL